MIEIKTIGQLLTTIYFSGWGLVILSFLGLIAAIVYSWLLLKC